MPPDTLYFSYQKMKGGFLPCFSGDIHEPPYAKLYNSWGAIEWMLYESGFSSVRQCVQRSAGQVDFEQNSLLMIHHNMYTSGNPTRLEQHYGYIPAEDSYFFISRLMINGTDNGFMILVIRSSYEWILLPKIDLQRLSIVVMER